MTQQFLLLAGLFLAFGLLPRYWPCNPGQPRFLTREFPTDILYVLTAIVGSGALAAVAVNGILALTHCGHAEAALAALRGGHGALAGLPLWSQVLLILVIYDVIQYWLHRWFHRRAMWPFHAIHHSSEQVDWITTFRVHPVNYVLYSTSVSALIVVLGFSPEAIFVLAPLNAVHAALVHANLNWTFGPFRYVLASPVFHRWHHVDDPDVRDKNFAPTFPILDVIFGTFYMPKGKLPLRYGVEGVPSRGYVAQLVYPFRVLLAGRSPEIAAPTVSPEG
jgi:sterol desaturase/sphingolipid hydroxylase (fatty acid hydroxylase superfamily)